MAFHYAYKLQNQHLNVQPSDLALNPPESYHHVQDGLIISSGVFYALWYFCYMLRTYRDKHFAVPVEYLCGNLAWEFYYSQVTTDSAFERICFSVWFLMDILFVTVALFSAYKPEQRLAKVRNMVVGTVLGVVFFHWLGQVFPEREQEMAYWTGWILELIIAWGPLYLLLVVGDARGHSLEIWVTHFLGVHATLGVWVWRYINVPENWSFVNSSASIAILFLAILPEFLYPFVYIRLYKQTEKRKSE